MELAESFGDPGAFQAQAVGYGAGHKDPREGPPNLVRIQLGKRVEQRAPSASPRVWLLETNLDDTTGEEAGHALRACLEAGALDAWSVPVTMKKSRPGLVVMVLVRSEARAAVERVLFDTTPTLGLRAREVERVECAREVVEVELHGAHVRVKLRHRPHAALDERDASAEFEDLERLAASTGLSTRECERAAVALALQHYKSRT
jgi:uncharacterized protein (DUF111 family)